MKNHSGIINVFTVVLLAAVILASGGVGWFCNHRTENRRYNYRFGNPLCAPNPNNSQDQCNSGPEECQTAQSWITRWQLTSDEINDNISYGPCYPDNYSNPAPKCRAANPNQHPVTKTYGTCINYRFAEGYTINTDENGNPIYDDRQMSEEGPPC